MYDEQFYDNDYGGVYDDYGATDNTVSYCATYQQPECPLSDLGYFDGSYCVNCPFRLV